MNTQEKILTCLLKNPTASQRDLARDAGVSLGLINGILHKFIKTGFIKVSNLNKRKLEYLLTPEGITAVSQKTQAYMMNTIRQYRLMNSFIINLLGDLKREGYRHCSVYGEGELKSFVESIIHDHRNGEILNLGEPADETDVVVLNVTHESLKDRRKARVINILLTGPQFK